MVVADLFNKANWNKCRRKVRQTCAKLASLRYFKWRPERLLLVLRLWSVLICLLRLFGKLLFGCYASDLRSVFRQIWNKNYRGCFISLVMKFFEPFIWSGKSEVSASTAELLQWSELALSISELFVLWRHPDECSNFAFSTAWDFIKVFRPARKRSQPARMASGGWLSIWVSPCQYTPIFV